MYYDVLFLCLCVLLYVYTFCCVCVCGLYSAPTAQSTHTLKPVPQESERRAEGEVYDDFGQDYDDSSGEDDDDDRDDDTAIDRRGHGSEGLSPRAHLPERETSVEAAECRYQEWLDNLLDSLESSYCKPDEQWEWVCFLDYHSTHTGSCLLSTSQQFRL